MILKALAYLSGFLTGFVFYAIAGEWVLNWLFEFVKMKGGLI